MRKKYAQVEKEIGIMLILEGMTFEYVALVLSRVSLTFVTVYLAYLLRNGSASSCILMTVAKRLQKLRTVVHVSGLCRL